MKRKFTKIWGVGLAVVVIASMLVIAAPASAALPNINEWDELEYHVAGLPGDWFRDAGIEAVGPMGQALDGTLHTYVTGIGGTPPGDMFKSTDGGRTWSTSTATGQYAGDEVINNGLVCSSLDADDVYVTDGNYVYKSANAGSTFAKVAEDTLEKLLAGACGTDITGEPITCLEVGYNASDQPILFVGVSATHATAPSAGEPSVLWINEDGWPSEWTDLELACYDNGGYVPLSIGCEPNFATSKKVLVVVTRVPTLDHSDAGDPEAEWSDDFAHSGDYSAKLVAGTNAADWASVIMTPPSGGAAVTLNDMLTITASPEWSWWYYIETLGNKGTQLELRFTGPGSGYAEMTIMDQAYGSQQFPAITQDEWVKQTIVSTVTTGVVFGTCEDGVTPIPMFPAVNEATIFAMATAVITADPNAGAWVLTSVRPSLGWIGAAETTAYIDDVTINGVLYVLPGETHVAASTGVACSWAPIAELVWDCDSVNQFASVSASRIGFPDDYVDVKTIFVGVAASTGVGTVGGDVYSVTTATPYRALDLNVEGNDGGCKGLEHANIQSLDIKSDLDAAELIAGDYDDTDIFCSADGGWTWTESTKDPTGDNHTYVLWAGDSALAATAGAECAVSLSCGEVVGKYWSQISLIATGVECVLDLSHSAGYITDSQFMYMLTFYIVGSDTWSLWRHDGTYWERVFLSSTAIDWVMASPQSDEPEAVYLANGAFDMWRSLDAGCSWTKLPFPCGTIPTISAWTVVDSETVIAGGSGSYAGKVYRTTRHGTRPWSSYTWDSTKAGDANNFDVMGDNVLLGDSISRVFISDDLAETWHQVDNAPIDDTTALTWVEFDPGFATSGDVGENMVYGAASDTIARCVIDADLAWSAQTWYVIDDHSGTFTGMVAVGDTVLYVLDSAADGGMLRTLNPTAKVALIVWERVTLGLTTGDVLWAYDLLLTAGENGCPDSNVLWTLEDDPDCTVVWFYEDTLATPVIQVSPATGAKLTTTTSATIEWERFCDTTHYEISLWYYCAACPEKTYVTVPVDNVVPCALTAAACVGCSGDTCCEVVGVGVDVEELLPGTEYTWKVRVAVGKPTLSKWSAERTFTTALSRVFSLCSPICGAQDVILTTNFSWDEVTGATGYEVQIATNEDFSPIIAEGTATVNAWAAAPELDYDTTYYWRVRADKDGVVGAWTTCIFTTEETPAELPADVWTCPQCGLTFSSTTALEAHIADAHAPLPLPITPVYIWVIIGIGALLAIAVILLIVRTRRVV